MAEAVVLQIVVETPNCSNPTCTHDVHSDLAIFFQHLQPKAENTMLQNPLSDSVIQLLTKIQNVVCFLLGNSPPENHPEESIQRSQHGKSLKSRKIQKFYVPDNRNVYPKQQ